MKPLTDSCQKTPLTVPLGHTKVLNDTAVLVSWVAFTPRALHSIELFLTLTADWTYVGRQGGCR